MNSHVTAVPSSPGSKSWIRGLTSLLRMLGTPTRSTNITLSPRHRRHSSPVTPGNSEIFVTPPVSSASPHFLQQKSIKAWLILEKLPELEATSSPWIRCTISHTHGYQWSSAGYTVRLFFGAAFLALMGAGHASNLLFVFCKQAR